MLACLWVVAALAGCAGDAGNPSDGGAAGTLDSASLNDAGATASSELPFAIEGAPCDAAVVDVAAGASAAGFDALWSFGGDYAEIGSFPLDAQTVFGSHSNSPDSLVSYGAALLGEDGFEVIDSPSVNPSLYYEPQDGSGDTNRIVWRSSLLGDVAQTVSDNWRLQVWDGESGSVRTLGTSQEVAGDEGVCFAYADIVPTMNAENAFFSTAVQEGDALSTLVLSYSLMEGEPGTVLAEGGFPAATDEGVVFASDPADAADPFSYSKVSACENGATNPVLTVSSPDSSWHVSGVWAGGDKRVVAFSSTDASAGSYLGVWADSFATPVAWLHAESPSVVASMNEEWLAWGAGSQAEHAEMYAYNMADGRLVLLGTAPGYSRPAIASDNNAVMVPVSGSDAGAVSFAVGVLDD